MNNSSPIQIMLHQAALKDDQVTLVDNAAQLEQQMVALDLSCETRRFLRNVHRAEKVLNNAYGKEQQSRPLDQQISQIYRELYGTEETVPTDD